jgi:hypothetical protein
MLYAGVSLRCLIAGDFCTYSQIVPEEQKVDLDTLSPAHILRGRGGVDFDVLSRKSRSLSFVQVELVLKDSHYMKQSHSM